MNKMQVGNIKMCAMKYLKLNYLIVYFLLVVFSSCEEYVSSLKLDADVTIHEFTMNNKQGEISEENKTIVVYVPAGTDVTQMSPNISLDTDAVLLPDVTSGYDFSQPVKLKVINGDVYSEYTIHVLFIDLTFSSFYLNGVRGTIDNNANTVTVTLPVNTDLTNLVVTADVDENAVISPDITLGLDFTNPVELTVSNQGESKTYTIMVELQETYMGFLGTYADSLSITEDDEKAAAEWFFDNFENGRYVSFDAIKSGSVDLSQYQVLWWYHDASPDIPEIALDAEVLGAITDFYKAGGDLLLNTHAVGYLWPMGRITNNYAKVVGSGGGWDLNDTWYVGVTVGGNLQPYDKSSHPVYQGLSTVVQGNGDIWIPLTSPGWVEDHNHVIIEIAPFHGFDYGNAGAYNAFRNANQVEWLGVWAGNRDYYMAGVMEFLPTEEFQGRVIAQGLGAFEFNKNAQGELNPDGTNLYQNNVERFTKNALEYLLTN